MSVIQFRDRIIDLNSGVIRHQQQETVLPPRLIGLLRHLVEHPDQLITRDEIIENVWGHL